MGHQHIRRDCQISSLLLGSGTDRDRRPRARQSLRNLAKSTRVEHAAGTPRRKDSRRAGRAGRLAERTHATSCRGIRPAREATPQT
jgi:hypothetical protein